MGSRVPTLFECQTSHASLGVLWFVPRLVSSDLAQRYESRLER